jgi:hypothetical protein
MDSVETAATWNDGLCPDGPSRDRDVRRLSVDSKLVYVVMETKVSPPREVIRVVCESKERAERYVSTECRDGSHLHVVEELILR